MRGYFDLPERPRRPAMDWVWNSDRWERNRELLVLAGEVARLLDIAK